MGRRRSWGPTSIGAPARCTSAGPGVERFRWKSSYPSELDRPRHFDPSRDSSRVSWSPADRLFPDQYMRRTALEPLDHLPRRGVFGPITRLPTSAAQSEMRKRAPGSSSSAESVWETLPSSPYASRASSQARSSPVAQPPSRTASQPLDSRSAALVQLAPLGDMGEDAALGLSDLNAALTLLQVWATLEATQGQILSQSPTDATSGRWHLNGS